MRLRVIYDRCVAIAPSMSPPLGGAFRVREACQHLSAGYSHGIIVWDPDAEVVPSCTVLSI